MVRSECAADGLGVSDDAIRGLVDSVSAAMGAANTVQVIHRRISTTADLWQLAEDSHSVREELTGRAAAAIYCIYGSHWTTELCDQMPGYCRSDALLQVAAALVSPNCEYAKLAEGVSMQSLQRVTISGAAVYASLRLCGGALHVAFTDAAVLARCF